MGPNSVVLDLDERNNKDVNQLDVELILVA